MNDALRYIVEHPDSIPVLIGVAGASITALVSLAANIRQIWTNKDLRLDQKAAEIAFQVEKEVSKIHTTLPPGEKVTTEKKLEIRDKVMEKMKDAGEKQLIKAAPKIIHKIEKFLKKI